VPTNKNKIEISEENRGNPEGWTINNGSEPLRLLVAIENGTHRAKWGVEKHGVNLLPLPCRDLKEGRPQSIRRETTKEEKKELS